MEPTDFMVGFAAGFLVALVLGGFFWNMVRNWRKDIDAPDKPQPIIHSTAKTPRQIMEAAALAWARFILICLLMIVLIWIAIEIVFPGFAEFVHMLIGNLWTMLVG